MYAGEMTADRMNEKEFQTAYFPLAAFVQHGPHLPITSGILIAQALAEEISTRVNAFMLPVQPFGTCMEQQDKYSIGVDPKLLYDMVLDIARELKRQGFRRLVLHQGYSGLGVLYPLTRHINAVEGIKTVLVNPCELAAANGSIIEGKGNFHACELQTSLMMYLHNECVRIDEIKNIDFIPEVTPERLSFKPISAYCPNGVWGRPSLANAEKGERLFQKAVELSADYIREAFEFMDKNGDYTGGLEKDW